MKVTVIIQGQSLLSLLDKHKSKIDEAITAAALEYREFIEKEMAAQYETACQRRLENEYIRMGYGKRNEND